MTIPNVDEPAFWGLVIVGALALFGALHLGLSLLILIFGGKRRS
jgi:hypothetical protein